MDAGDSKAPLLGARDFVAPTYWCHWKLSVFVSMAVSVSGKAAILSDPLMAISIIGAARNLQQILTISAENCKASGLLAAKRFSRLQDSVAQYPISKMNRYCLSLFSTPVSFRWTLPLK